MSLAIRNTIVEAEIYTIQKISDGHPVYLLEGFDDMPQDTLVVKLEGGQAPAAVAANVKIMNVIDKSAKQKVLTPTEVQELRNWAGFFVHNAPVDVTAARAFAADLVQPGTWVKMGTKRLTTLDSAMTARLAGDKADVRLIARALKRNGGLEKLGSILVADLFNGSSDRFVYPGPGMPVPFATGAFQHLQNIGNVFVSCDQNNLVRPIGLDGFDPYSDFKNPGMTVNAQEHGSVDQWPGRLLASTQGPARRQFATGCVADLETVLGPRNRKIRFASKLRLGGNAGHRIAAGMDQGINVLKQKMLAWRANPAKPMPPVMTSRMQVLGW